MSKALNSSNYMAYVEKRLEHWAKWFSQYEHDNSLGYPTYTRAYVLMTLGTMIQSSKNKPLPYDEEAE